MTVEEQLSHLIVMVGNLESRMEGMEQNMNARFDRLEEKVDKLEDGQFELKQNMAVLIEAQTALSNQEQRHYEELSARVDNLERIQKEQCYDIIKLRAAQ